MGRGGAEGGWHKVTLQSFMKGRYVKYWIVEDDDSDAVGDAGIGSAADDTFKQVLLQYAEQDCAEQEQLHQTVQAEGGLDKNSLFVKHMGWAEHLRGKDMASLKQLSEQLLCRSRLAKIWNRRLREEYAVLWVLTESFDRVMGHCMERLPLVPHETRRWINSISPVEPSGKPLERKAHESTTERYMSFWRRYLCYCLRAKWTGREAAAEQRGIRFEDEQWGHLQRVAEALEAAARGICDGSPMCWNRLHRASAMGRRSAGRGCTAGRGGREGRARGGGTELDRDDSNSDNAALDEAGYRFCITSIKQKVAFHEFINPLLHFTAVLGIDRPETGKGYG